MQKLTFASAVLALIISVSVLVLWMKKPTKIGYVNIETVYNEFQMKKELESKFQNVQNMRKNILDSLKLQLNVLSQRVTSPNDKENIQRFELLRQEYLLKEEQFMQDNQATTEQYASQIWKQLSQYVKQYGKEHHYSYVLGMETKGTVLYGNEAEDITNDVKTYINAQYQGGAK